MGQRAPLALLWFDPEALASIRARAAWSTLLDAGASDAPLAQRLAGLLGRAEAIGEEGLRRALDEAVSAEGAFAPPLVLLEGDLHPAFDPIASLEVAVTLATPRAATDAALRKALDTAAELLRLPSRRGLGAIAGGVVAQLRAAFARAQGSAEEAFDALVTQALLEERCYERRVVFGERRLRCLLALDGAPVHLQAYLPEALETQLPMFERFPVRLIAEAQLPQDAGDLAAASLRVVALGRSGAR